MHKVQHDRCYELSLNKLAVFDAAGFITYAGNWQGQGSGFSQNFISGSSLYNFTAYPASVPAYESWPSTYISASNPEYYGNSEVVVQTLQANGKTLSAGL